MGDPKTIDIGRRDYPSKSFQTKVESLIVIVELVLLLGGQESLCPLSAQYTNIHQNSHDIYHLSTCIR